MLLEHSHTHLITYYCLHVICGCLPWIAQLSRCDRADVVAKSKIFSIWFSREEFVYRRFKKTLWQKNLYTFGLLKLKWYASRGNNFELASVKWITVQIITWEPNQIFPLPSGFPSYHPHKVNCPPPLCYNMLL